MASIAELNIKLAADVANLQRDLSKGRAEFRKFAGTAKSELGGIRAGFETLKSVISSLGVGLTAGAFIGFLKTSVAFAGQFQDLSEQLRIGVVEIQALDIAAREAGIGTERMEAAISRLNESIGEAVGGNREVQQSFVDLGVAFETSSGKARSNKDVLTDLATAYEQAGDKTKFLSDLTNIMGREAGRLGPILEGLSGGWDGFIASSEHAGIITQDVARDLDRLGDTIEGFKNNILKWGAEAVHGWQLLLGIGLTRETELSVEFDQLFAQLEKLRARRQELLQEGVPESIVNLRAPLDQIIELEDRLRGIQTIMKNVQAGKTDIAGGDITPPRIDPEKKKAESIHEQVSALAELNEQLQQQISLNQIAFTSDNDLTKAKERLTKLYEASDAAQRDYAAGLRDSPLLTGDELKSLNDDIDAWQKYGQAQVDASKAAADAAKEAKQQIEDQKQLMQELTNTVGDLSAGLAESAAGFQSWADFGKRALDDLFGFLFDQLKKLEAFGGSGGGLFGSGGLDIGGLFSGLFGGLFGGGGAQFAGVPSGFAMAEGGQLGAGQWAMAGEAGPELIRGPATVIPMDQVGGGMGVTNYFSIDARGATRDAIEELKRTMRAINASVEPRAVAAVQGSGRRGGRTADVFA